MINHPPEQRNRRPRSLIRGHCHAHPMKIFLFMVHLNIGNASPDEVILPSLNALILKSAHAAAHDEHDDILKKIYIDQGGHRRPLIPSPAPSMSYNRISAICSGSKTPLRTVLVLGNALALNYSWITNQIQIEILLGRRHN